MFEYISSKLDASETTETEAVAVSRIVSSAVVTAIAAKKLAPGANPTTARGFYDKVLKTLDATASENPSAGSHLAGVKRRRRHSDAGGTVDEAVGAASGDTVQIAAR